MRRGQFIHRPFPSEPPPPQPEHFRHFLGSIGEKGRHQNPQRPNNLQTDINGRPARLQALFTLRPGLLLVEIHIAPRASFIISVRAFLKRKASISLATLSCLARHSASIARSTSSRVPSAGTFPSKYLCANATLRLTKFPNAATSSPSLRSRKILRVVCRASPFRSDRRQIITKRIGIVLLQEFFDPDRRPRLLLIFSSSAPGNLMFRNEFATTW